RGSSREGRAPTRTPCGVLAPRTGRVGRACLVVLAWWDPPWPSPTLGRVPKKFGLLLGGDALLAQEREDGHHPAVHLGLLAEPELVEQGVDVLLDGTLREEEALGDGGVVLALRHEPEDLALPLGELREGGLGHPV